MITVDQFWKATGYAPKDDDMDRCNCPKAGTMGHTLCGWNHDMGLPVFIAVARAFKQKQDMPIDYNKNLEFRNKKFPLDWAQ